MTKTTTKYGMFGLVAFAAILTLSIVAYNFSQTAIAEPANKTMIGEYHMMGVPNTTGWTTIISGHVKTSTPSDLVVSHNQECAIHTGLNLDESKEEATSAIREDVRLVVDGQIVPATFGDPVTDPPNYDKTIEGTVTMCGRAYSISTNVLSTLFDLCEVVVGELGAETYVCPDEIFFDSFIRTKQAHSWEWVVLNVGSGVHTVEIQAKLVTSLDGLVKDNGNPQKAKNNADDSGTCSTNNDNCVDTVLELGKRNLIVLEDKLSTFATIQP